MFELCPLVKEICPFCGISKGVYHCGVVKRKGKKKEHLKTRIDKLMTCPEKKGSTNTNIVSNPLIVSNTLITEKTCLVKSGQLHLKKP